MAHYPGFSPVGHGVWLAHRREMLSDPRGYAAVLYDKLHQLDRLCLDWIAVERPPETAERAGMSDTLTKAAV